MDKKMMAVLLAPVIMLVSFSGDHIKTASMNSTGKLQVQAVLSQTESSSMLESGVVNYSNFLAQNTAPQIKTNDNLQIAAFSVNTSLNVPNSTVAEQNGNDVQKSENKVSQGGQDIPKTVTISTKKKIKPAAAEKSQGQRIADYAYTFSKQYRSIKGLKPIPYVYGADGPNSFDCSGFVNYVYRHFGIGLGRSTGELIGEGKSVKRSDLKPGDLVFPGPGHVMLYIGNGQVVHAPETGDVVRIASLPDSIYAIRRIVDK
ncbi:MAG: NlpC/P60 family protein [Bacillota bacterium]|nr:NlpC/P60 family protein [Bacillota bacterium]